MDKNAADEDVSEFFKNSIFNKPSLSDIELYQNPTQIGSLNEYFILCAVKRLTIGNTFEDSVCTCQDFRMVNYCLHLISALMHYGKGQAPLPIAAPGRL